MPVLDGETTSSGWRISLTIDSPGFGATSRIREIESQYGRTPCRILALTGMSTLEDKRRAFEAGVDG